MPLPALLSRMAGLPFQRTSAQRPSDVTSRGLIDNVHLSVFSLFDGLAIGLFDGFELLGCCVTRYVGGETGLCKTVMWDMRDTARRWSKFAET
jgi:hypothetical protein